jgi:DNA-binding response OmpR family regulator
MPQIKLVTRIVLVDDEIDVISLIKIALEMNGFEVDTYTDPLALSDFKAVLLLLLISIWV